MSQSTVIVSAVIVAFIVWVTLNGSLGTYLSALGLGGSTGTSSSPTVANALSSATSLLGTIGQGLGTTN